MLLELAKHDFPDLHRRLRAPVQPTAAQTASAVAALPPLPQGSPFPLQAPHNIAGGAAPKRKRGARGAGARVEMSPESREKADKKNLSKRMKRAAKAAIERSQLLMKKD